MGDSVQAKRAAWNLAGRIAWYSGHALYRAGLWLCGVAGDFDGRADSV